MNNFIELCRGIKSRPNMYMHPVQYYSAVNLVTGYDYATNSLLLEGFHEWLNVRLGFRCSWHWGRLFQMIVFPKTPDLFEKWSKVEPSVEQDKLAISKLFDELEEFYLIKKDRNKGLRWIYAQYDELCKKEDEEIDKEFEQLDEVGESLPCICDIRCYVNDESEMPIDPK